MYAIYVFPSFILLKTGILHWDSPQPLTLSLIDNHFVNKYFNSFDSTNIQTTSWWFKQSHKLIWTKWKPCLTWLEVYRNRRKRKIAKRNICLFLIYIHSLFSICDILFPSTGACKDVGMPSTFLWISFATVCKVK